LGGSVLHVCETHRQGAGGVFCPAPGFGSVLAPVMAFMLCLACWR